MAFAAPHCTNTALPTDRGNLDLSSNRQRPQMRLVSGTSLNRVLLGGPDYHQLSDPYYCQSLKRQIVVGHR